MAEEIHLRLYEELNDFLPPPKRKQRFSYPLRNIRTVEELLTSLCLPENDIELVLVNGASAGLSHLLHGGDYVSIYPVFEAIDVSRLLRLRDTPLRRTNFIAGARLFRLGGYLRQLGFDTLDARHWHLEKTVCMAERERRTLLTRDPSLLKSPEFSRIYLVQAANPRSQLLEVLSRFDLFDAVHFSGKRPALARILRPKVNSGN